MGKSIKKPWCIDPFIQMAHTADGFFRVCCIGAVHRDRKDLNTKEMTPLEYWNSDVSKQIRNDMLKPIEEFSNVTKFACNQCLRNKRDGVRSRRDMENLRWHEREGSKVKANVIKHIKNINYTYEDLLYVNFKVLGNICNLKCVMCSPNASSKIAAEAKKYDMFPDDWSAGNKAELEPFTPDTRNDYFTELQQIIDSIPKFNLVGGENLIHPDFPRLFEMFINSPNISNIDMLIITNGTIVPDIVQDNAHLFKSMSILISMDGVFERGSYVRSGLNWKKFDANVRKFASNPSVFLRLVPAIQMLNVGYVKEMHDWIESVGLDPKMSIDWNNVVTYPDNLRAINLPKDIKQEYMRKMVGPDITHPSIRVVFDILKQPQYSHKEFLSGLKYLRKLDKIRNTNLLEHFPEFEKYIGEIDDN